MLKGDAKGERVKEFLAEAEDILNTMGKGLFKLGKGVKAGVIDPVVLNSVFRCAHTLKGISGIFDFKDMAELSHSLEDILDMLRLGRVSLTNEVLDAVMATHELLTRIAAERGGKDFSQEAEVLKETIAKSYQPKKPKPKEQLDKELLSVLTEYEEHRLRECLRELKNIFIVNVKFPVTSFDKSYVALTELLKTQSEVIATLPSAKTSHDTLFFDVVIGTAAGRDAITSLLKDFQGVDVRSLAGPPARGAQLSEAAPSVKYRHIKSHDGGRESLRRVSNTVRVNIKKLDNIMNIVSELGILKSNLSRLTAEIKNESRLSSYGIELARMEKHLDKKFTELRDGILDVRMVQIGQLFGRFEPFIDKLARETGKEVRMGTYGDDTELDKLIVEELADPLMHIVKNIIDHAIEAPAVREALGKPRTGTVTLGAYQKGNHVVVEVSDDGTGIDEHIIGLKAVEKGLVPEDYLKTLSRQEILELIFMPGFTTRDVVSATSGRGVGMDVVRENITNLSGIIDLETEKGKGTRFMLTIPITLAIVEALIVEEGSERYAVPMSSVIEIAELGPSAFSSPRMDHITIGARNIPSIRLGTFFGMEEAWKDAPVYGIVAGLAEHRLCILVDKLVEEHDVVIKPLPKTLKVPGIAGATDMGDKGTILVLDLTGMLEAVINDRKVNAPRTDGAAGV